MSAVQYDSFDTKTKTIKGVRVTGGGMYLYPALSENDKGYFILIDVV